MVKASKTRTWQGVLCFSKAKASRATVRRYYTLYRREMGLLPRCDNPVCTFHTHELRWNGAPLSPVVDHISGVSADNRPKNLRLLCPNCDAQLMTRGGLNKGRVQLSGGGYAIKRKDGKHDYTLIAEPGAYKISDGAVRRRPTKEANA